MIEEVVVIEETIAEAVVIEETIAEAAVAVIEEVEALQEDKVSCRLPVSGFRLIK